MTPNARANKDAPRRPLGSAEKKDEWRAAYQARAVNLPKVGGAIKGIGEKFAADPVTGSGSMILPTAARPGPSSFGQHRKTQTASRKISSWHEPVDALSQELGGQNAIRVRCQSLFGRHAFCGASCDRHTLHEQIDQAAS